MNTVTPPVKKFPQKVLLFSDEHIGAKISNHFEYQCALIDLMTRYDHVIMTGDDFELFYVRKKHVNVLTNLLEVLTGKSAHAWKKEFSDKGTAKANVHNMIRGGEFFLREFLQSFPDVHIHKVLGNHEDIIEFRDMLDKVEREHSNFEWDPEALRVGDALVTHGHLQMSGNNDKTYPVETMDTAKDYGKWADFLVFLERPGHAVTKYMRSPRVSSEMVDVQMKKWDHMRKSGELSAFHVKHNGVREPFSMDWVKHLFFGHTHVKFDNLKKDDVLYHNTGAIVEVTSHDPKDMGLLEAELNEDGTLTNVRPVFIEKDKHIGKFGGGFSR